MAAIVQILAPQRFLALAALASAAALGAALLMQHAGGLAPCPMCIQQRWGFGAAGAVAALGLAAGLAGAGPRIFVALAGVAFLATFGLALRHAGVEAGWWPAPASCTAVGLDATTVDELREQLLATPPARCDEVPARFLGLSIAGWSALASLGLAALAGLSLLGGRRGGGAL